MSLVLKGLVAGVAPYGLALLVGFVAHAVAEAFLLGWGLFG